MCSNSVTQKLWIRYRFCVAIVGHKKLLCVGYVEIYTETQWEKSYHVSCGIQVVTT